MPEVTQIQRLQAGPPRIIFGPRWLSWIVFRILPFLLPNDISRGRGGTVFRRFFFGVTEVRLEV